MPNGRIEAAVKAATSSSELMHMSMVLVPQLYVGGCSLWGYLWWCHQEIGYGGLVWGFPVEAVFNIVGPGILRSQVGWLQEQLKNLYCFYVLS